MNIILITILTLFAFTSCKKTETEKDLTPIKDTVTADFEIKGISFVAINSPINNTNITPLENVGSNWIAQMPFAHGYSNSSTLKFNQNSLWWGETFEGIKITTALAKQRGIKTMLKPQIWIHNSYTGAFVLTNENDWQQWENNYQNYVLGYAHLADSIGIDMFCIGTELKLVVQNRPAFWNNLIDSIKTFYDGKLIYAANWDDYNLVPFWDKLDYIGIDGYFPLSTSTTPSVEELVANWQTTITTIDQFRISQNKDVVFTEIGYKSVDACAHEPWNPTSTTLNLQAQSNSYQAFFEAWANKPWFRGAFLWKWYPNHTNAGGSGNIDYTPQNKPAEFILKKCF